MPSSEISHSEARDLLHKFITESTKVSAVFFGPKSGFKASVSGTMQPLPDGSIMLLERQDSRPPCFVFEPARAKSVHYGDERVVRQDQNPGANLFRRELASGITFWFEDGSSVGIFELKDQS